MMSQSLDECHVDRGNAHRLKTGAGRFQPLHAPPNRMPSTPEGKAQAPNTKRVPVELSNTRPGNSSFAIS